MIGGLVKELKEEIDINDLPKMENMADLFSELGKGGNSSLGKVIGKVAGAMDKKMKSGQMTPDVLMKEMGGFAGLMMGGAGGAGGAGGGMG